VLLSGGEDVKEMPTISIPGRLVKPSVVELVQLKHLYNLRNVNHLFMLLKLLKLNLNHILNQRLQDAMTINNLNNPSNLKTLLFNNLTQDKQTHQPSLVKFAVSE